MTNASMIHCGLYDIVVNQPNDTVIRVIDYDAI